MAIILRIDVDTLYPAPEDMSSLSNLLLKLRGAVPESMLKFFRKRRKIYEFVQESMGFASNLIELAAIIHNYDCSATIFFPDSQASKCADVAKEFIRNGFDIGLHLTAWDRNKVLEYKRGFDSLIGHSIDTFSVHSYEPYYAHLLDYLRLLKEFKIFSGNSSPDTMQRGCLKIFDGFFFPSAFFTRETATIELQNDEKYTVDWLLDWQKKHDVVICVHPEELSKSIPDLRLKTLSKLHNLLTNCKVLNFTDWLRVKA